MPLSPPHPSPQAGFTLIFMMVLLTVSMLVFTSFLPGQEAGNANLKATVSIRKLEKVEEAMRAFMAFNLRRPCPADGSNAENTANFGTEAATPGTCTVTAGMMGSGNIVVGTIPTKALGLPDDYALDAWGRHFTYVVDKRATLSSSCGPLMNYPVNNGVGGIKIESSSGVTPELDDVMYAYISHGPDGFGAFPEQGSTAAARLNNGSTDADQFVNAEVNSSSPLTTNVTGVLVQKGKTATFDDIVYYRPDIKNTCCLGAACTVILHRKAITIDHTKVGSADLTNFPLLVAFSNDTAIGAAAASNGQNIRFTSQDGSTQLKYERQSFSISGGAATGTFWVRIPTISHTADTVIYIYYGNSGIADGQDITNTWNGNYLAVWHLEQNPSGSAPQMTDSTSNAVNGTTGGSMTSGESVAAEVGNGLSFDGVDDYVDFTSKGGITKGLAKITLSYWVKLNSLPTSGNYCVPFIETHSDSGYTKFSNSINSAGNLGVYYRDSATNPGFGIASAGGLLTTGTWYYITVVVDTTNSQQYLYLNGQQVASGTAASNVIYNDTPAYSAMTGQPNPGWTSTQFLNGIIDEMRITNVANPANWVSFEYHNIADNGHDITFGTAQ